jgi:glycosyltransferase involved in cell wall biosynthesis
MNQRSTGAGYDARVEPLTIVHVLEKNRLDTGSVQQMLQAATGLRDRGHRVIIVSRPGGDLEGRAREDGLDLVPMPLRSEIDLRTIARLRSLFRERRPDVVHVHKGLAHTLALAAAWTAPPPAFVVNRGVTFPLSLWNAPKYRSRRVDRIVAVSESVRDVLVRSGRVPAAKIDVIYAGTDVRRFDPARWSREEFRAEKGIGPDEALLLLVGLRAWKGWSDLVDTAARLLPRHPRLRVVLVGCRSERVAAEVRGRAVASGIGDRVLVVEYREDMPRVLAAADCVIDASWEGTGITGAIREAMAMERPVIATDCGGNRELVPGHGWIVPRRDAAALAAAIDEVLASPERAREIGRAARARVVAGFSMARRIERLEELYREIIEGKRR